MATVEKRGPTRSGALSNDEAAALIGMILANTSTAAPAKVVVPDSPRSLTELFPVALLAAV